MLTVTPLSNSDLSAQSRFRSEGTTMFPKFRFTDPCRDTLRFDNTNQRTT